MFTLAHRAGTSRAAEVSVYILRVPHDLYRARSASVGCLLLAPKSGVKALRSGRWDRRD